MYFVLLFISLSLLPCAMAQKVTIVSLDNNVYEGKIVEIIKNRNLSFALDLKNGEKKTIEFLDIVEVICHGTVTEPTQLPCFFLNDGSRIYAELLDGNPRCLSVRSPLLGEMALELTLIEEIRFKSDDKGKNDKIGNSEEETDVLYFDNGDVMKCLIDQFAKGYVQVQHRQLGMRKEYLQNIRRITFAQLETPKKSSDLGAILLGTDNSKLYGEIVNLDRQGLLWQLNCIDKSFSLPFDKIRSFFFINGRFVYISDLPKEAYQIRYTPYFSPSLEQPFLPKLDRNQAGGPIRIGKQTFYKGIGVLSRTEITVNLDKKYKKFQSHIGIDVEIQNSARENPLMLGGSVLFEITVDGEKKFESGIMRWDSEPKLLEIDVSGKKNLVLFVDFADNGNAGDYANWGGARLIR